MESTLLLDMGYQPLAVISWQEAVRLVTLGKSEVIEEYDRDLRSTYLIIKMPAVIRLLSMFKRRKKKVKFSRINIYARDKYRCQYCGTKGKLKDFTFDHVQPKSRGGRTTWENIVTCCEVCNCKKGNRTPREANMKLKKIPVQPKWLPVATIKLGQRSMPDQWASYLYWNTELED